MLQLIPKSDVESPTHDFVLDQKKGAWTPSVAHLRSRSFPTPFAQAEMMTHVLGLLKLDSGARQVETERENPYLHQSFERWKLVVLGLVLGLVEVETVDLRSEQYDNFGRMLADLRSECRFLTLLRHPEPIEGTRPIIAVSDPQCLLWCSPRWPQYWTWLKTQIDAHAAMPVAKQVLADWRAVLAANQHWNPSWEKSPPWLRAMHLLLDGVSASPGWSRLLADARFVGPVLLALPDRGGTELTQLPLYLPVLTQGWSARFQELLFLQPFERSAGVVTLEDTELSRRVATIVKALTVQGRDAGGRGSENVTTEGSEFLLGVGQVQLDPSAPRSHGKVHWLDDHEAAKGYRSLVLVPLLEAATRAHHRTITDNEVREFPTLFPDALRLVCQTPPVDNPNEVRVMLSRSVVARRAAGIPLPQSGLPVSFWHPGDPLPNVVAVPGNTGGLAPGLVERFGADNRREDVGELRALGLALWLYFLGEVEVRPDGGMLVWAADEGQELFGRAKVNESTTTLEIWPRGLQLVLGEQERARARDRRATLQRFARCWSTRGEGKDEDPTVQGERLGRIAAEHFLAWAMAGAEGALGRFGPLTQRAPERFALGREHALPLFLDDYARWE